MKTAICPFCGKKASKFIKFRGDIVGCEFCGIHTKETNADRIRAMTDEELAKKMSGLESFALTCGGGWPPEKWLEWLREEVKDGDSG